MNKETKALGKIATATFGIGGYQDAMFGLHLTFKVGSNNGWVCYTKSFWDYNLIECSPNAVWSEKERDNFNVELNRYISRILNEAKVNSVDKLVNIPVEITFDGDGLLGSSIKDWRVLTEVL